MINVLVTDDHKLVRCAVARMLGDERGLRVAGEARDGEETLSLVPELKPHVVLMDLFMPGIGGLETTRRLARLYPDVKVIALSASAESPFPEQMLKAGALGYLTKGVSATELWRCIRKVYFGQRYVSADVAQQLAFSSFDPNSSSPFESLSRREMQIMMMVVSCHKVQDISGNLHLSPKTVNSYRYRIFDKLNVSSDVELTLLAVRHGMLNPDRALSSA